MNTRLRLATAAVVSAGLHAFLISGGWLALPASPPEHLPLEARLAPAPPPAPSPPPRSKAPAAKRAAPPAAAVPPVLARAPTARSVGAPVAVPSGTPEVVPAAPEVAPEPVQVAQEDPAGQALPPDRAPPAGVADPAPAHSLPRKGTITFTLSGEGFNVGRAVQSWEVGAGSYKLASDAETTGIVEVFRPQRLRWLSKGKITRLGLRPESFLVSRTRRGQTEASEAQFDWKTGSLTYGPARERATAALPGDTQDIMSFIYQLSIAPPAPGRYRLPITTGSKFETYDIEVRSEEAIETPLGTLRTLPVKQRQRPGAESIEIWLAAEYRYLPVKIRYFNREGNPVGEQVASDIRVSED